MITPGVDGLLTTPRNSEELALAIGQLLENDALRRQFIQAGLQKALEYAWPQVARRIMDYYYELIEERDRWLAKRRSLAL